jgi:threonine/homoserine/homoserine lactone efflux protein
MDIPILFITAFGIGLSGALIPGPFLSAAIVGSIKRGFRYGPLMVVGHSSLELALVLALLGGVAAILTNTIVANAISVLGGAFLIFMGISMGLDVLGSRISLRDTKNTDQGLRLMNPVIAGLAFSLANPTWWIWWATVGLSYITMAMKSGWLGLAAFYSGHLLADLAWYSLVAFMVTGGRKFMSQRLYNGIVLICAVFVLVLGVYFICQVIISPFLRHLLM